jgi:hypothetical protein
MTSMKATATQVRMPYTIRECVNKRIGAGTSELDAASSAGIHTNFTAVPYAGFGALSLSGASENENSYATSFG